MWDNTWLMCMNHVFGLYLIRMYMIKSDWGVVRKLCNENGNCSCLFAILVPCTFRCWTNQAYYVCTNEFVLLQIVPDDSLISISCHLPIQANKGSLFESRVYSVASCAFEGGILMVHIRMDVSPHVPGSVFAGEIQWNLIEQNHVKAKRSEFLGERVWGFEGTHVPEGYCWFVFTWDLYRRSALLMLLDPNRRVLLDAVGLKSAAGNAITSCYQHLCGNQLLCERMNYTWTYNGNIGFI